MLDHTGPLVSVPIITYNQESYLPDAVDSVLAQDYAPIQIVIADDGSVDGTTQVANRYAERFPDRVTALTGGPNLGATGNVNRALRACQGELVAFLDGDDLFLPGKVRAQVQWFGEDRQRVLCGHDIEHFDSESGRALMRHTELAPMTEGRGPRVFLTEGPIFAASSVMVRRAALPAIGFDERLRFASDWKAWVDTVLAGGRFGHVPGVLGRYRHHSANITVQFAGRCWTDALTTLSLVEGEHPELADFCRRGRSRLYQQRGVSALLMGDMDVARASLRQAVLSAPERSIKAALWWALAQSPTLVRSPLVTRARRSRP